MGLEQRDEFVLETDWLPLTAYERTGALLESSRPPDAFLCASDELALGVMLAIEVMTRILERPDNPPPASVLPVELAIRDSTSGMPKGDTL